LANRAALIRTENAGLEVTRRGRRFIEFALPGGEVHDSICHNQDDGINQTRGYEDPLFT
jgi:hypothetical protein